MRTVIPITAGLCLAAAGLGLAVGLGGDVTETDVIDAGAALYEAETGGARTECVGVPGQRRVWIIVRCGENEGVRTYLFDRDGTLLDPDEAQT